MIVIGQLILVAVIFGLWPPITFAQPVNEIQVPTRTPVDIVAKAVVPTPTPEPTPEPPAPTLRPTIAPRIPANRIESIIIDAARRHGANVDQLLRVAWCESKYDPNAYNAKYGASGLFQFIPSTWAAYGHGSVFDPEANADAAASLFAAGQAKQWECK